MARRRLRLFPLNAVLFPGTVLNLHVFEPRYKQLIGECVKANEDFGVVLIREGAEAGDPAVEPHEIGSVAEIVDVTPLPFGRYYISTIGRQRFRIRKVLSREPYLTVDAELLGEDGDQDDTLAELGEEVREAFKEYSALLVAFGGEHANVDLPSGACEASYIVGDALRVTDTTKQRLLELEDTRARLNVELRFLRRLLPQLRKLVRRREALLRARRERGEDEEPHRDEQERYFGKYFSLN